jgi:hypothetical protein
MSLLIRLRPGVEISFMGGIALPRKGDIMGRQRGSMASETDSKRAHFCNGRTIQGMTRAMVGSFVGLNNARSLPSLEPTWYSCKYSQPPSHWSILRSSHVTLLMNLRANGGLGKAFDKLRVVCQHYGVCKSNITSVMR